MKKKIIFSSGGTGGHIYPALSAMDYFISKGYLSKIVTDLRALKYIDENKSENYYILNTDTPVKKNILLSIWSIIKIFFSIIKSILILKKEKPNIVIGIGGYVSFPLCLSAFILKIPLILYENNLVLGKSNKFLLPFAKLILTSTDSLKNVPEKYRKKIKLVGHVLRKEILTSNFFKTESKNSIFTILVLGGSQGAEIFGNVVPNVVKKLKEKGYELKILQQCTSIQKNNLVEFYKKNQIDNLVFEFKKNIADLMINSDLAISRSGASTIAELEFTQTPFIAIPYPYATDKHQYFNAKFFEAKKCCWLIEQEHFNSENLLNLMIKILQDKNNIVRAKEIMLKNDTINTLPKINKIVEDILYEN